jgi:hypothetical protein
VIFFDLSGDTDMKKIKQRDKSNQIFILTMILVPCIVLLGLVVGFAHRYQQETGILDVCADQQDARVKQVLNQVVGLGDWESGETVTDILTALDSSDNQYWTFSSNQTLLFVKNKSETSTWSGFTTATYYSSDSAQSFYEQLRLNRVTHAIISIDGVKYLASGVVFNHQDVTYQLCLLTSRDTVLDNNHFTNARILYWILIVGLLCLVTVIPIVLAIKIRTMSGTIHQLEQNGQTMNLRLNKYSEDFADMDLHNTRFNLWRPAVLSKFAEGLQARGASPVTLMRIHCDTSEDRKQFLNTATFMLDHMVLRFAATGTDLILIFAGIGVEAAESSVTPLLTQAVKIQKSLVAGTADGITIVDAAHELESM